MKLILKRKQFVKIVDLIKRKKKKDLLTWVPERE